MPKNTVRFSLISTAGAVALAIATVSPAVAQNAPPTAATNSDADQPSGIADIVVTAERRVSSVQTTPLAITAVTGDSLQSQQVTNVETLTGILPNVSFSRSGGDARIFIRGIGLDAIAPGSDPRVALYTDGTYNPRVQAAFGSFFDLERIEVLSGPQGTLYGRNATAGAVNIISRDPGKELNGYGRLTVGNYSTVRTEGAIGVPLSDTVGIRLAFQTGDRSGFGKNIVSGSDVDDERTRAVRAKLKYDDGKLAATLQGDYFHEDDHSGGYHIFGPAPGQTLFATTLGGVYPTNPRDFAGPGPLTKIEAYGTTGTLEYDLGPLKLTSISAYKHLFSNTFTTPDGSTIAEQLVLLDILDKSDSFTQEVRLGGKIGFVDVVVGAYYFHEKSFAGNDAGLNVAYFTGGAVNFLADGAVNRGRQNTDAYAVFTQNTINVTDQLGIDIGARYSSEKRRVATTNRFNLADPYDRAKLYDPNPADVTYTERRSWSSFDPKVGIHFQATPEIFLYASYSSGFKSGGFNVAFIQPSFDPEEIEDIEAGIKADLFDRRLRLNLAGFHYKYKNLQVNTIGGALNNQLVTENAARAKLYGLELNAVARPVDNLQVNFDAAYLHTEFEEYTTRDPAGLYVGVPLPDGTLPNLDGTYSLSGHPLTYAPKWKLHGAMGYTFRSGALEVTPRVDATYSTRVFHSAFKLPFLGQKAYTLLDLYVDFALPDQKLTASLFVKNATNTFYKTSSTIGASFFGYPLTGLTGAPRTFGISIGKSF